MLVLRLKVYYLFMLNLYLISTNTTDEFRQEEKKLKENDDQKLLKFPLLLTISLMVKVCGRGDEFIIT